VAAARRRGHDLLVLGVGVDHPDARRFYARLGFVDWGHGPIVSRWVEPDGAGGFREVALPIDVMVRSLWAPPVEAWRPWSPAEIAARLAGVPAPWHLAGGVALELWRRATGREPLRSHGDVEIAVARSRAAPVLAALRASGKLYAVGSGAVRPLRAGLSRPPARQVWCAVDDAYRVDVFLEPGDARTWVFRRDERVRRPYREAIAVSADGPPYLRPECVLLYKAAHRRPRDEADFAAIVPDLEGSAREWLARALAVVEPEHPWRGLAAAD
jgi:hypothetical protein